MKLFMLLLGCKPNERKIEQHDIFFGVAESLKDLAPYIERSWKDAGKIHIDAWREINVADGFQIKAEPLESKAGTTSQPADKLFFINLGGYKQNEFDEFHYKMLLVCKDKMTAIKRAKESTFYLHTGFEGAVSHIDDKYGVDVDDIYEIEDICPTEMKEKFYLQIKPTLDLPEDEMHLGYLTMTKLQNT